MTHFVVALSLGISRLRGALSLRTLAWDLACGISRFKKIVEGVSIGDFSNDIRSMSFVRTQCFGNLRLKTSLEKFRVATVVVVCLMVCSLKRHGDQ